MITTRNNRPVFLNLFQIRLPIAGIMSIGHRISGMALVFVIPYMISVLDESLSGAEGFAAVRETVAGWPFKVFLFLALWALMHHFLAGIRYLLMDVAIGVDKPLYQQSALAVLVAAPVLALALMGVLS